MIPNALRGDTRTDDQTPVRKARDTTTRRTRTWRRRIVFAAAGLALAFVLRRRRGDKRPSSESMESSEMPGSKRTAHR